MPDPAFDRAHEDLPDRAQRLADWVELSAILTQQRVAAVERDVDYGHKPFERARR